MAQVTRFGIWTVLIDDQNSKPIIRSFQQAKTIPPQKKTLDHFAWKRKLFHLTFELQMGSV